jgi:hypothetical protein
LLTGFPYRAAGANRRLADEYDAAQERGEIKKTGNPNSSALEELPGVSEIGLTHKDIHEARIIRDAEVGLLGSDFNFGARVRVLTPQNALAERRWAPIWKPCGCVCLGVRLTGINRPVMISSAVSALYPPEEDWGDAAGGVPDAQPQTSD